MVKFFGTMIRQNSGSGSGNSVASTRSWRKKKHQKQRRGSSAATNTTSTNHRRHGNAAPPAVTTTSSPAFEQQRLSQAAERYWDDNVAGTLSLEQKALLAQQLFCHIWRSQGDEVAIRQILNPSQQLQLARLRFDRGCQLWNLQNHQQAEMELHQSQNIHDAYGWTLKQSGEGCKSLPQIVSESEIQLHYATGMVHVSMGNYPKALQNFRQSWRQSVLELGEHHLLSHSSQHMLATVLCRYYEMGIVEVHYQMNRMRQSIIHEKEADAILNLGADDLDPALAEYEASLLANANDGNEYHAMCHITKTEEAAIRVKMAAVLLDKGQTNLASEELSTALGLYHSALGSTHPLTLETLRKYLATTS